MFSLLDIFFPVNGYNVLFPIFYEWKLDKIEKKKLKSIAVVQNVSYIEKNFICVEYVENNNIIDKNISMR